MHYVWSEGYRYFGSQNVIDVTVFHHKRSYLDMLSRHFYK
jgi:hypothetical protein